MDLCVLQGHPRLVNALAKLYSPILGRDLDPMEEVVVTVGAYGSLFCTVQGFINPGDEVGSWELDQWVITKLV